MDAPLAAPNNVSSARKFLFLLALCAVPFAASQITIYDLLFDVVCREYHIGQTECSQTPEITKIVANILSVTSVITGITATIVSVVLSAYTDRVGRKFGLLWFIVFTILALVSYPLLAYGVPANWTHWRMVVPYFFMALSGSPSIMLNLSVLYLTDLLPDPQIRTKYLSLLMGSVMCVQAIAPGIGSAILKSGVSLSHYLTGCSILMTIAAVQFYLFVSSDEQEDMEPTTPEPFSLSRIAKLATFQSLENPTIKRNGRIVFLNFIMSNMFAMGFLDVIMVYAKHRFEWSGSVIGENMFKLFSIRTLWAVLGFPVLYSLITKRWPAQSETVDIADLVHMYACNILTVFGYILLGSATTSRKYSAGLMVLANDGIAGPVWINSLLKHVDSHHKGEFMAALNVIIKPVESLLPALIMKVLNASLDSWPQFVFYLAASLTALLVVSQFFLRPQF